MRYSAWEVTDMNNKRRNTKFIRLLVFLTILIVVMITAFFATTDIDLDAIAAGTASAIVVLVLLPTIHHIRQRILSEYSKD